MAINTIGATTVTSNSISGKLTTTAATTIPFTASAGDVITITATGGGALGAAGGTSANLFCSGGSHGNTFAVPADGTTTTFFPTTAISSLTLQTAPYNFLNTSYSTFGYGSNPQIYNIVGNGNQTILAGGDSSTSITSLRYSTDSGATWSSTGSIIASSWKVVAYNANASQWLTQGAGNFAPYYSTNLTGPWTAGTGGTWTTNQPHLTTGGGNLVSYSSATGTASNYSTNGATWTSQTLPAGARAIRYVNGIFILLPFTASDTVYTSTNGSTWTARSITGWAANRNSPVFYEAMYYNNTYYVVGPLGVATSTDGTTWSYLNPLYSINQGVDTGFVTTDGKFFISAAGSQFKIGLSPINFTPISFGATGMDSNGYPSSNMVYCSGSNTLVAINSDRLGAMRITQTSTPIAPIGFTITNVTKGYTNTY